MLTEKQQLEVNKLIAKFERENAVREKATVVADIITDSGIYFKNPDTAEFKRILDAFPVSKDIVVNASGKDVFEGPYRVDIENPAVASDSFPFCMKVSWETEFGTVHVTFKDMERFDAWIQQSRRTITSSEYHYFVGMPESKLYKHQVMCYVYRSPDRVSWYGGNQTLTSHEDIDSILDMLIS